MEIKNRIAEVKISIKKISQNIGKRENSIRKNEKISPAFQIVSILKGERENQMKAGNYQRNSPRRFPRIHIREFVGLKYPLNVQHNE